MFSDRSLLVLCVMCAAATMGGCATYVNIPPQSGDVAWHDPNGKTATQVVAAALQAVAAEDPGTGPYLVALPEGTLTETYQAVLVEIDDSNMRAHEGVDVGLGTFEIKQVRVRGWNAAVDVLYRPGLDELDPSERLTTAYLKWSLIDGWTTASVRRWHAATVSTMEMTQAGSDPHWR